MARANYLALDRADIRFAVKERVRQMDGEPSETALEEVRAIGEVLS